ncbi:MAG: ChaN family lipoprotein, partial [Pseudomonadota bacterium]
EGKTLSFDELVERIAPKDLIFVGEVHDNPEHHLIQVQILQALIASPGPLVIAMEFFQQGHQVALDRYLRGEITEAEFLRDVNWNESWGYDYLLYRPLLLMAKEKGIKVLALNAPAAIVKKVAREGLKGLDLDERDQLPLDIDLTVEAHRAYLLNIYRRHPHEDLKDFEYFYEAQCVWEETMARNLSKYQRETGERLVVFAGSGHIIHKFGIPDRTIRRSPAALVTIMPYPIGKKEAFERETADYVWLTPDYPHRAVRPSMGRTRP